MRTDLKNMLRATGLTVSGRVTEATSFLQRLLAHDGARPRDDQPEERATADDRSSEGGGPAARSGLRGMRASMAKSLREMLDPGAAFRFDVPANLRSPPGQDETGARSRGEFLAARFGNSAGMRPYKTYVPAGYRGQAVPLLVMLHGCKQSPDDFAVGTRMNVMADEQGFIVVYPGQTTAGNGSGCWNWFAEEHQHRDRGEPSLIAGITRSVMREYVIDPDRVYVAGLSAGGAAAAVLGATYPDLYAAIGVHSGLACGAARDLPSAFAAMRGATGEPMFRADPARTGAARFAVPVIVFHGDADTTVHPANSDRLIAASIGARSFEKIVHHGTSLGGRRYTRMVYVDASGRSPLEQWAIHGGGHAWAGGDVRGSYTDPAGPSATREMIRFFLEHPRALR